jgi:uncharacterized protein YoxC
MTVQVDIFTLIIAFTFLLIAIFLIPMLMQLKKMAQEADVLLSELRRELVPTLREIRETAERLNRASGHLEEGAGRAGVLLQSLGEVGQSVHNVNDFLQHDIGRFLGRNLGNATGLWLGLRAASKVVLKGLKAKGD